MTLLARSSVAVALVAAFSGAASAQPEGALTIERAVELALASSERSRIADRSVDAAEARVARARAFFFPDFALGGTYTHRGRESTFQEQDAFSAVAQATLTIFDARSFPLHRQAKLERDAARLSAADDKRRLAFQTADTFLATLGLEQVVEAAGRRVELSRQSVADARGRVEADLASSNDLTRAELELATAERELVHARGDLAVAYQELGFLVGAELAPPLASPDELLAAAGQPLDAQRDAAASRRLDLAAARKHAQALDAFADEPRMRWFPSVGAIGQYRVSSEAGFVGNTSDWSVAVTLTWVLWDGGERGAERRERVALAEIGDLQVAAAERHLAVEVQNALTALDEARGAFTQGEAAVEAARRNAEETAALYRQGLARAIEVTDAAARLFEAEVALAREGYGLALAVLGLRDALGLDPFGKEPAR